MSFGRVVVTKGMGRRLLVTEGYGGLRTFEVPTDPETGWVEETAPAAVYTEEDCYPQPWEETIEYPRFEDLTPFGCGMYRSESFKTTVPVSYMADVQPRARLQHDPGGMPFVVEPAAAPHPVMPWQFWQIEPFGCGMEQDVAGPERTTVIIQAESAVHDTFIRDRVIENNELEEMVEVREDSDPPAGITRRGLFKFDHSIPAGVTIVSAAFTITVGMAPPSTKTYYFHRIIRDFPESATWFVPWAGAGCSDPSDYDSSVEASTSIAAATAAGREVVVDVTELMQISVDESETSFKLRMVQEEAHPGMYSYFYGVESWGEGVTKLEVVYEV